MGLEKYLGNFYSKFLQAQVMNPCHRITIYNYCEQNYVSGDTYYTGWNDEQQEDFRF